MTNHKKLTSDTQSVKPIRIPRLFSKRNTRMTSELLDPQTLPPDEVATGASFSVRGSPDRSRQDIAMRLLESGFSEDRNSNSTNAKVFVGAVISPVQYFVSPMRSVSMMSWDGVVRRAVRVEAELHRVASTLRPVAANDLKRLDLVAVKVTDGHWRRGRVCWRKSKLASVFLVDLGNLLTVKIEQLKNLPLELSGPPNLGHKFVIRGVDPLGEFGPTSDWSAAANTLVSDLVAMSDSVHMVVNDWDEPPAPENPIFNGDMLLYLPDTRMRQRRKYHRLLAGRHCIYVSDLLVESGYAVRSIGDFSDSSFYSCSSMSSMATSTNDQKQQQPLLMDN